MVWMLKFNAIKVEHEQKWQKNFHFLQHIETKDVLQYTTKDAEGAELE